MESGRGSEKNNDNHGKRKLETNTTFSEITNQTIEKIKRSRTGSSSIKAPLCTAHDMTSPGYEWLLPGWVAEERHMQSGRVYRYFYDPEGNSYKSKTEVKAIWEKAGIIVLDG